ncbi:hypothetical protein CSW98_01190 [Vibrio sp. HA2012]|uniref:hypothetical protein n=1 Tax=Vibrio sp. HA2012 TaxID=1971595 RepID=UPI000C2B91D4|nr:hypothetical protein [Vibrio sp. HA2012]PJC87771.1 hypothetical protein CSW98_01190 [Vibrio sp. HA2012]
MRKILITAGLLLASSSVFSAQDPDRTTMSNFSYDYIEARIGMNPVTFGGAYSKSIHPNAHAIVRGDSEFDQDYNLSAGLGFHAPINNWADLTGEMLGRLVDNDDMNSEMGLELNIGVRQWLGPQLEVGGRVGYVDIDADDDIVGTVFARFHSTELFTLGLEGTVNGFYDDQVVFTTRFKF